MSELKQALRDYCMGETFIASKVKTLSELNLKYEKSLNDEGYQNIYHPENAEVVFKAYRAIEDFEKNAVQQEQMLEKNEAIIKKYLEPLKGKSITYVFENGSLSFPRYLFSLQDGIVTHNLKKQD